VPLIGRIACGIEEIPAFLGFEERADAANGLFEGVIGSGLGCAHMGFEFGEGHFDGVQIGTVGRQEQEPSALCFEASGGCFAFVAAKIIENDHIALIEGGCELGLGINLEGGAVHGTVEQPGSGQAMEPQTCNKGLRPPSAKRRQGPEPVPAKRPAVKPGHLRIGGGFINKDKPVRHHPHKGQALRNPDSPRLLHVSAFLLRRQKRFFYK